MTVDEAAPDEGLAPLLYAGIALGAIVLAARFAWRNNSGGTVPSCTVTQLA